MTPDEFKRKIAKMSVELRNCIDNDLPKIIGNRAVKMFKENFQGEGFFGERWKNVKRRTNPPKRSKHPADATRKILTGRTGNLGRSIKCQTAKGVATIYSDLPYSKFHNDGTNRLPRRRFLANHPKIEAMAKAEIERRIGNILK